MSGLTYAVIFFFVLALIGHGWHSFLKIRKHLHLLQLNSYFNERYVAWLHKKRSQVFSFQELRPLLAVIGLLFHGPLVFLVIFSLVYFRLLLTLPQVPEKKPLVFTARATRLLILSLGFLFLFDCGLFVLWWSKGDRWLEIMLVVLVGYNFLVPVFLMLANWLLLPIEHMIQQRYSCRAHAYLRTLNNLKVVGITGSFGKTSTKYILSELLRQRFITLKTPGSYNTPMGITKTILGELKPIHEVFVVEMSAKKPGDIREICRLVAPRYGLITAIGEQHLETFGSLENIKNTKNELLLALPTDGVAFLNFDDRHCRELAQALQCRVVTYGSEKNFVGTRKAQVDYPATDLTWNEHGSNFKVTNTRTQEQVVFQTPLLGRHNVSNVLGAIAVASELGMELTTMMHPLRQIVAVPHRLELKRVHGGVIFIDDAFNSNTVGSQMALEVLAQISGKRKMIVTPGMIELGVKEDEHNERFGEQIGKVCDYVILVGMEQTLSLQRGLKQTDYSAKQLFVARDFAAAKSHLEGMLQAGDVVLWENDLPDNYNEF